MGQEAINAGKFVISKKQAKKVKTPVLLFQAGKDTLVTPGHKKEFIKEDPRWTAGGCARYPA